ncbi:hypothetical protein DFP72DRAFT_900132 [Ephemerocybe angulata]|uniref:Hydrophobin n=1 Tax=Ephemerocybe angulata TaxID=980116 RepID=A0A8H6HVI6_9AGAR|nr:hypothetical protein DFP72DRAFT_900132 [Tulosesus angulatus]
MRLTALTVLIAFTSISAIAAAQCASTPGKVPLCCGDFEASELPPASGGRVGRLLTNLAEYAPPVGVGVECKPFKEGECEGQAYCCETTVLGKNSEYL